MRSASGAESVASDSTHDMRPDPSGKKPAIARKSVDLPTPLGPVTSAISPEHSRKHTPPNTTRSPRATERSSIRRWHRGVMSIFISGCPLSRSDRFRTPGWNAYRNVRFWISVFERKAALGRTAQEDEEVQFFGATHYFKPP